MLAKLHSGLIAVLATFAGAAVVFLLFAVIYEVVARNLGLHPPDWTSTLTEYCMLITPALLAPWLVRANAHIVVDSVTRALPLRLRRAVGVLSCGLSIVICAVVFGYAGVLTLDHVQSGALDIRSISVPKWILSSVVLLSFGFMAVEFMLQLPRWLTGQVETRGSADTL